MPQVIVTADPTADPAKSPMTLRERINLTDFESQHFIAQLVERLEWAVGDAQSAGETESAGRSAR